MDVARTGSRHGNREKMGREPDPQVVSKTERRQFSVKYKVIL